MTSRCNYFNYVSGTDCSVICMMTTGIRFVYSYMLMSIPVESKLWWIWCVGFCQLFTSPSLFTLYKYLRFYLWNENRFLRKKCFRFGTFQTVNERWMESWKVRPKSLNSIWIAPAVFRRQIQFTK